MGRYNRHMHRQNLHHLHYKSTFLPMLCSRPSIKDVAVALPKSNSFSNDPLSPKIGCMGQVKRNNKIVGFPSSHHHHKLTITTSTNTNVKYSKLKKLFSGKNPSSTNTPPKTSTANNSNNNNNIVATSFRGKQGHINGTRGHRNNDCGNESNVAINIVDMDPPLPVTKKVNRPNEDGEGNNLYKRRSGGVALKSLQLQKVQINGCRLEVNSV